MSTPIIALLTDFGHSDPFVGIVKGVIASIAPEAIVIDLAHDLPPGDIRRAAITLWQATPFFPSGTIFLAVVDPGVGTSRRPVIVQSNVSQAGKEALFIGPDNGLFTFVLGQGFKAWELSNAAYRLPQASKTFHGRDIFAPAAAHAVRGVPAYAFGPPVPELARLPSPRLQASGPDSLEGEILHADRFGNYLTSLGVFLPQPDNRLLFHPWLPGVDSGVFDFQRTRLILPDGTNLSLVETFGQIPSGKAAALVGSSGLLEIAANRLSAAELLNLARGTVIRLVG